MIALFVSMNSNRSSYKYSYSSKTRRSGQSRGRGYGSRKPSYSRHYQREGKIDLSLLVKKAGGLEFKPIYKAKNSFEDFEINAKLKQNIKNRGYTTPTPIQDDAIPQLLQDKNVVGIANTGTGKTAAFLIPLINKLSINRFEKVLIIVPTRELAVQIQDEFTSFTRGMGLYSILCIGGVGIYPQIKGLQRNPNVVIGTPGRLKDLEKRKSLNFSLYNSIVLDEVDRMLDMGFIKDISHIISHLPEKRQSLFFSATLSSSVRTVMEAFVRNPVTISVKSQETPINVDQDVIRTGGRPKIDVLADLLRKEGFNKVLIFGRTKWGIEGLAKQLVQKGFNIATIHGNKNQNQRQKALDHFKQNKTPILLATDVASRGLDINDITHVINYDLPKNYEDYIHRIGRTGRANKKGTALSFID